ncbi:MAG: Crp/Fnr family transcriptional regulator [Magnetococcales bacterium]|nr:Crp/Fnr family transcriptional regulator [Magnetococcales bacterium]
MRRQPLFSALTPDQRQKVAQSTNLITFEKGVRLFSEGDEASHFFLVARGQIKLSREASNPDREKILEIVRPGSTFATALMFLKRNIFPVSATALTTGEVYRFDNHVFMSLLRDSPETCFRVLAVLSHRLHDQVEEIDGLCLQNAPSRLVQFLLQEARCGTSDAVRFQLTVPKQIIAARISVKPESLSRILNGLSRRGLLTVTNKEVEIPSIKQLQEAVTSCNRSCQGRDEPLF